MKNGTEVEREVKAHLSATELDTGSEAYNTGFEAAAQGELRMFCPYPAGSWDAYNWLAGWDAQ